jgi:WD repeat-containing protein 61
MPRFLADSKTLLTACDDMHVNLYNAENQTMIESFSGEW